MSKHIIEGERRVMTTVKNKYLFEVKKKGMKTIDEYIEYLLNIEIQFEEYKKMNTSAQEKEITGANLHTNG